MSPNTIIFTPILAASALFFCISCYRRFSLVTIGSGADRTSNAGRRLKAALTFAFGQKRVVSRSFGLNHVIIFWSFLILLIANGEFLLKGIFPAASLSLLPSPLYHGLIRVFDLVSLAVLASVVAAGVRRIVAPPYNGARTGEAFAILGMIAVLMLAYFGFHGTEIALGKEPAAAYMPVSEFVAGFLSPFNVSTLQHFTAFCWWLHALVLLVFMNYLPHSKHMHILTAIPNCFFRELGATGAQSREEFARGKRYGAAVVTDFTWKDLFDSFSCTECGRCQKACPAETTGKPLNPRRVIHDIKVNLLKNGPLVQKGLKPQSLIGEGEGRTSEDALWSCTTCGACMTACPVFIEQMPKLVKMRRHLVQMKARFPDELLNLFENMESRSNPWGMAPGERTKWCTTLDVKPFEAGKTEYLLYVGCAGAFDSRQKHVTVALAAILDAAGVSWGILGKEELCCGDSLRRLGNEFAFDRMARENVRLFQEKGVTRVITQCPHCFSTLKNDYRQYGLELEVIHHSELLESLLGSGKLRLNRPVTELGSIVFHDSCYLGRHNDVYEPPRAVIAAATGNYPLELARSRADSFCCGAGGGRMWMEEHQGGRINLNRVEEALGTKSDTICVSCPYCMTMLEDGLKDLQAGRTKVRDIAEVVAEGLRPTG